MSAVMAWRGMDDDQGIWWSLFDGGAWSAQQGVPDVASAVGPSLTSFAGQAYMAWRGMNNDQLIYYSTFDGQQWAPQAAIPGVGSSTGPGMASALDRLILVWKGVDWGPGNDDEQIWYTSTTDGHTFADQQIVPGAMTVSKPALATLSGTGEIYLVWNDSQGRIWWSIFDGALWGRPQETALPLLPEPTVLAVSTTRYTAPPVQAGRPLMLIALQHVQGSDEQYVSTSSFDGATWAAPTRITDGSGPALAWFGGKSDPPTAELILAGTGPHGQNIWWQRYADGAWGLKQPIDGVATHGAPAIAFIDT